MNVDIFIKRLRLYGRHGVLPQEREVGANFYVTLTAAADVSDEALLHDRLEGTVDYSKLVEVLERERLCGWLPACSATSPSYPG